jgi:predicted phosphate transport protein (TIGR00153 family)
MRWFINFFKPKQDNFMKYLIQQAEIDVRGLGALVAYMKQPSSEKAEEVHKAEGEADEVRRMLVDDLNRTFVTPIDREDIYTLSGAIDDLVDYAKTTVEEMGDLKVAPTEHLLKMAQILFDASTEIHLALQRLEEHPTVAHEHAQRAKKAENLAERTYRQAIAELFNEETGTEVRQVVRMLKTREILRHLSNAADRADAAANVISNIVVKMT